MEDGGDVEEEGEEEGGETMECFTFERGHVNSVRKR